MTVQTKAQKEAVSAAQLGLMSPNKDINAVLMLVTGHYYQFTHESLRSADRTKNQCYTCISI